MSKTTFDITINDNIVQRVSESVDGLKNITIFDTQDSIDDINFSTILDIRSTKSGVSFPDMTTAQMNAIPTPKIGMVVHNLDDNKLYIYTTRHGWFTISGLNLPTITTQNGIVTWGEDTGSVINNTSVTIDSSGNMVFPINATLDLSNSGTLKAESINAYTINCQALVAETNVNIQQLTTAVFNADHATLNNLVLNSSDLNIPTTTITAAALNLNINGCMSTVSGYTTSGNAATAGSAAFNGTLGTVINTNAINSSSKISVTRNVGASTPSDVTTIGSLIVGSIINGSSFTVYSTVENDTGNFDWFIINP